MAADRKSLNISSRGGHCLCQTLLFLGEKFLLKRKKVFFSALDLMHRDTGVDAPRFGIRIHQREAAESTALRDSDAGEDNACGADDDVPADVYGLLITCLFLSGIMGLVSVVPE